MSHTKYPTEHGICRECKDMTMCPMNEMLRNHSLNQKVYGADYRQVQPDLWEQDAIQEPDTDRNYDVKWCPMFLQKFK